VRRTEPWVGLQHLRLHLEVRSAVRWGYPIPWILDPLAHVRTTLFPMGSRRGAVCSLVIDAQLSSFRTFRTSRNKSCGMFVLSDFMARRDSDYSIVKRARLGAHSDAASEELRASHRLNGFGMGPRTLGAVTRSGLAGRFRVN
jgi:hypothetical protein